MAVQEAAIVITMLPTADVVNEVIFDGKVAEAFSQGAVWAQMGTIGVGATIELASRLRDLRPDVLLVDAPVSGSKGPAEAGQLLILASGPAEASAILKPAFSAIGRKTVWLGDAGQGSRMKLVVNAYMSASIRIGSALIAAALALAQQGIAVIIVGRHPERGEGVADVLTEPSFDPKRAASNSDYM